MLSGTKASATKILVPVLALAAGIALPVAAQQARHAPPPAAYNEGVPEPTDQDNLRTVATNVNAQRSELFRKKDLAGAGAMYTPDAAYIELMPRFEVMMGRAQIQQHFHELMTANTSEIVPTVTTAEMDPDGEIMVGGDYYLLVQGNKKVSGHFFQVLRKDGGTWKIAMHGFARAQPVTVGEVDAFRGD